MTSNIGYLDPLGPVCTSGPKTHVFRQAVLRRKWLGAYLGTRRHRLPLQGRTVHDEDQSSRIYAYTTGPQKLRILNILADRIATCEISPDARSCTLFGFCLVEGGCCRAAEVQKMGSGDALLRS